MARFSHTKKLIEYAYEIIANLLEFQAIFGAEQPEIDALWEIIENGFANNFIMLADETGIEMYEKMLNIVPKPDETLDERRAEVLAAFQDSLPYTRKNFENLLAALGIPRDDVLIKYPDNFHMTVGFSQAYASWINFVSATLERMTPFTMAYSVGLREYTWGEAKANNWNYLPEKTWEEFLYNAF
jgi:hypothetical protein